MINDLHTFRSLLAQLLSQQDACEKELNALNIESNAEYAALNPEERATFDQLEETRSTTQAQFYSLTLQAEEHLTQEEIATLLEDCQVYRGTWQYYRQWCAPVTMEDLG